MRGIKLFKRITACALVLLLAVPFTAMSDQIQESAAVQSSEKIFKPEELEQMLALIALYPDALLAQVFTAATYPLEVVAADRFVKENQGLKGEALLEAARDKDWEPSVKAMLAFPDVLAMMDEQLEWTGKLGDAFLAQQGDCMDAVQRLRQKAYAQGNLATTEKQVIRVEPQTQIIIIEPASIEVVYVPVYDPAIIYGDWWYPAYPPYYFYPRRYYGISFFPGVFVRVFWGVWGTWICNWHSRDVYINVNHYNHFTKASYAGDSRYRSYRSEQGDQPWRYDARHRMRVTVRPGTADSRQHDQTPVRSPRIDARESARPAISEEPIVRKTIINSSVNVKPSFNVPVSRGRDQTSIKRIPSPELRGGAAEPVNAKPAVTVDLKSHAGNQRSARTSTGDLRIQETPKPATVTESPKDSVRNQIIARPTSDDSRRQKDDDNIPAAKSRGRIMHAENDDLQVNRRFAPAAKDFNVLRGGLAHTDGR